MKTKTYKAIALYKAGEYKKALAIFSTFRIGFTEDERRTLKIAHECYSGQSSFYEQLGISAEDEKSKSLKIIERRYNL